MTYRIVTEAEHFSTGERLIICRNLSEGGKDCAVPWEIFREIMKPEPGSRPEAAGTDAGEDGDESPINPAVLAFVEEEDIGRRLDIFRRIKGSLTRKELDVICEVLDLSPGNGDISKQAETVESCLKLRKKYSGTRLR